MRAAIKVLLLLALGVAAVLWLAGLGGSVEIRQGDWVILVSLPAIVAALLLLFGLLHGLLRGIAWLRGWPARRRARRAERDRAEADRSLTLALVALAAGRGDAARIAVHKARVLAGDTPQLLLLSAEAARLTGDEAAARADFEALAARDDAKFLGLRGLLRQAEAREDWTEAQRIAAEAQALEPGAEWLKHERSAVALRRRDWTEALALAGPDAPRAALSLAAAAQQENPLKAAELERQAFMADPAFAPAVLAHAKRLAEGGSPRRGRAVLRQGWEAAPHPDIGAAWLEGEASATGRFKLAEELVKNTSTLGEARLLKAQAALQAGLTGRARQELGAWLEEGTADRRAHDAMVQVERADGDEEAAAEWLRRAADAPAAPGWRCFHCGAEHGQWKPLCAACDTPGEIGWTGNARAG